MLNKNNKGALQQNWIIVKWQRSDWFPRHRETTTIQRGGFQHRSTVSDMQWKQSFPSFRTSCTMYYKINRRYINKHVAWQQSCHDDHDHTEKKLFLGSYKNGIDKSCLQIICLWYWKQISIKKRLLIMMAWLKKVWTMPLLCIGACCKFTVAYLCHIY